MADNLEETENKMRINMTTLRIFESIITYT